jgi:rRNA processing protein Gar1
MTFVIVIFVWKLWLQLKDLTLISTFKYAVVLSQSTGGSDEEDLRRLGKILHLSKSRSLIVKCDEARFVKLGTKVCDSKLKEVGKVQDLFGPVTSPYFSVRPTVSSPSKVVHRIVYSLD